MKAIPLGSIWTPGGWRHDIRPETDPHGRLAFAPHARSSGKRLLPGIANLHSHAFQRAMAGMAERQTDPSDSFWTWRETMYRFATRFSPDTLYAVAAQLYAEMLEAGYTTVCEFHYLHHAPDGRPYSDPSSMSQALVAAARDTGIRLTLLPVLYMTGGFDGRPLGERQRRFGHDIEAYLHLLDRLCEDAGGMSGDGRRHEGTHHIGCALHSLRAVPPDAMREVLAALPPAMPVHVHIAEQVAEVEDCLAVRGARPVEWLLANADVDARWTLVHATHLDDSEVAGIARSGATVAICPTTEANLGDGLFPLRDFLDAGGRWGIGSDSHISVSPVEELRWLEYGQRLVTRRRNIAVAADAPSVGETLMRGVAASAARSSGYAIGLLEEGAAADVVVLDAEAPQLAGATDDDVLDRWIFSGNRNLVDEVFVAGTRVVHDGCHRDRDAIAARYRDALAMLMAG
ncbi:formimidoylglutamate deiminase [Marilutibacter alkalisoli]|uniref:Formimidoylglutamate deiminase n=1 Tax=Marilutibacter alkalisoli TaxID=2591633 RepID=A0A514BQ73_9GAMM|nr:formimidoylglutamate deiminase [Lysobacter alkalisoli]QDH69543.1 formimidoylglutamate deiminase [Lysobacter alkalisoli]